MAVKVAVGPAMAPADRRPPEWFAPDRADHAADDSAGRTGDDETRSSPRHGAHRVGSRAGRRNRPGKNNRTHQKLWSFQIVP